MRLSLIVAMTRAGVISRGGQLPWRLSADLKRFKSLTMGHHLIMGRKTFDSLGRLLPGRTTVIVTRQKLFQPPNGALIAHDVEESLRMVAGDDVPFVIGGGEIYSQTLPHVKRLYVTWVESEISGDTWFPAWQPGEWRLTSAEPFPADAKNEYDTTFCIYERT